MAIILLVPLILMIPDLPLPIQRQRHQAIDRFARMQHPRRVLLPQLEDDLRRRGGHDLRGERAGVGHDFRDT